MDLNFIKEELEAYTYEKDWLKEKENEIEELQEKILKITTTIKSVPIGKNPINDRLAKYVADIEEMTGEIIIQINKCRKIQKNIEETINK